MENGVQCVELDGIILMLVWYVDNWDGGHLVDLYITNILKEDQDLYFYQMSCVQQVTILWLPVVIMDWGLHMVVIIVIMMLE